MNARARAIEQIQLRPRPKPLAENRRPSEMFGENVFKKKTMKHYLSKEVYLALKECIEMGKTLDRTIAGPVANAMKSWAMDLGATHYTHWFQPLSGRTAEKHDSFLEFSDGEVIDKFSGDELAQQEPDASAFPSGGLRSTFEARGYTAWDCSSMVFIFETTYGKTLCIPTIFVSYRGDALDHKTPLLRSISLLDKAATTLCQFFDSSINRVSPTLGIEQEYFLVDKRLFQLRPDLLLTGRTLFGAAASRSQRLDGHYFGAIPERAYAFMNELERDCHRLGIPLKTRHNEVAPGQFECAPRYEILNQAVDHGLIMMDLIDRTANKHHFAALLHEKPFEGINGSGKHLNWSLMTDTGKNLLAPGKNPSENLMFLAFFISVIKAVHDHADLLRASIASAGNELRLGKQEAPPTIMSVFIGRFLTKILHDISNPPRKRKHEPVNELLRLGINEIPELFLDNTDQNRTSPFAFTGNKFEFRALGASASCSHPMMVLNVMVADQLIDFQEKVEAKMRRGRKLDLAALDVIKEFIEASQAIRFEGDSYSHAWLTEAEKRGLSHVSDTPRVLAAYLTETSTDLFVKHHIFTSEEIEARHEIQMDAYLQKIRIEADVMEELTNTQVIPAALDYQRELLSNIQQAKACGLDASAFKGQSDLAARIGEGVGKLLKATEKLAHSRRRIDKRGYSREMAMGYCEQILPLFTEIRQATDALEGLVADRHWPLAKYRELLFVR